MSNIRVFVQWKNSTVFAGEAVECQITFTNISQSSNPRQNPSPSPELRSPTSGRKRWKESLPSQSASTPFAHFHSSSVSKAARPNTGLHRSALSLNSSTGTNHAVGTKLSSGTPREIIPGGQRHKRSVSIVSMGGEASVASETYIHGQTLGPKRPGRGHTRTTSLQVLPRRTGVDPGPLSCRYHQLALRSELMPYSISEWPIHFYTLTFNQSLLVLNGAGYQRQRYIICKSTFRRTKRHIKFKISKEGIRANTLKLQISSGCSICT